MRYHNITHDDMLNGDGLRVVLWVAGCEHHCKGCQNPSTWDIDGGIVFDDAAKKELFDDLKKDYISGITFSGGDPMHLKNRPEITKLAKEIKELFPKKTIWMYTGYCYEEIKDEPVLSCVDVLVDGPFEQKLLDKDLPWRGSRNQRVIDVPASREKGTVILKGSTGGSYETLSCSCCM